MPPKIPPNDPLESAPVSPPAKRDVGGVCEKVVTAEKDYWNDFYGKFNISHPSQFCVMTAIETDRSCPIVEFGCGNGRDSIYFATHGYTVYGCDLSKPAIEANNKKSADVPSIKFRVVDASCPDAVWQIIEEARSKADAERVTVYTRFFLHSIDEKQQAKFFSALGSAMRAGDMIYHEYRSKEDALLDKVHGKDHYRRYIDTPVLCADLEKGGYTVNYENTGRGMAKYKQEDPFVSRVIATKN